MIKYLNYCHDDTMPKYNDNFSLDLQDIDLIEKALHSLWSAETGEIKGDESQQYPAPTPESIRQIHKLLGKISGQKVYYNEVNQTSCPAG